MATDTITALKDGDSNAGLTVYYVPISALGSGNTEIIASVSNMKLRVLSYVIMSDGTVDVKWRSANTDITGAFPLIANTGASSGYNPNGHFQTARGEALNLNLSVAGVSIKGHVMAVEIH